MIMKRRDALRLAAGLALIPLATQLDRIKAAPLAIRKFDDAEPYGFVPRHRTCKKWEKDKDK
jgi:hypothetical protein